MTALAPEHIRRVYFVHLDMLNNPVRVNSSGWTLYWNNLEWLGVGYLGEINGLGENIEMSASQITLSISGIPNQRITDLHSTKYQERDVFIYQCDLDANYQVNNSRLIWAGFMDTADVEIGDTAMIQMRCESPLALWNRQTPRRMNDQQQQRLHAGDRGLQYVAALRSVRIEI